MQYFGLDAYDPNRLLQIRFFQYGFFQYGYRGTYRLYRCICGYISYMEYDIRDFFKKIVNYFEFNPHNENFIL